MENTKSYAFTQENCVGRPCPPVRTPLLQEGDLIRLCQPDSFLPLDKSPALVVRDDAKSPWRALTALDELESWLSRPNLLGVWVDRNKWGLFGAPDGKIQEKEVETLEQRWQGLRHDEFTQFEDLGYRTGDPDHPAQRCVLGWWHQIGEVDPAAIHLLPAAYPDKVVAVLEEPRRVTHHEVIAALRFESDKARTTLLPSVTDHLTHTLEGTQRKGFLKREECLARGQKQGNPSYVLPT